VARSAYRIHTNRLVLRCWSPDDAPLLASAITESLDHLRPWMPWAAAEPKPLRRKVRQRLARFRAWFHLGENLIWGIFDPAEARVLGGTGLHCRIGAGAAEIGYWIHAGHVGQGLGTEAAAAVTRVGFEVERLKRLEIHCDPANVASAAIPRKLGYDHQVTVRRWVNAPQATPRDTSRSMLGVCMCGLPRAWSVSKRWSSVKKNSTFGRRPPFADSRPKTIAQKIKAFVAIISRPILIFAVNDFRLLWMQFQLASSQPLLDHSQHDLCLSFCKAMDNER